MCYLWLLLLKPNTGDDTRWYIGDFHCRCISCSLPRRNFIYFITGGGMGYYLTLPHSLILSNQLSPQAMLELVLSTRCIIQDNCVITCVSGITLYAVTIKSRFIESSKFELSCIRTEFSVHQTAAGMRYKPQCLFLTCSKCAHVLYCHCENMAFPGDS